MSAMTCQELVELITAHLDGTLDASTEHRFADHLQMCKGCERYLDQFKQVIRTCGELPPESLPGGLRDSLLDAFRNWSEESSEESGV